MRAGGGGVVGEGESGYVYDADGEHAGGLLVVYAVPCAGAGGEGIVAQSAGAAKAVWEAVGVEGEAAGYDWRGCGGDGADDGDAGDSGGGGVSGQPNPPEACIRARVYSCRKTQKIDSGFSPCLLFSLRARQNNMDTLQGN